MINLLFNMEGIGWESRNFEPKYFLWQKHTVKFYYLLGEMLHLGINLDLLLDNCESHTRVAPSLQWHIVLCSCISAFNCGLLLVLPK